MTMTEQWLGALGYGNQTATRRLRRAQRQVQRTVEEPLAAIPPAYLWIGIGVAAATVAAIAFRDRLPMLRGHTVGDVMVRDVLTIESSATLTEAAQKMRDGNVGMLPVVENGRLRGVVTDRDIVVRGVARNMDLASTPVRYVSTDDLAAARADWEIADAMHVMADCQVGRLPVIDSDDRVIGVVTLSSLALRSREQRDALSTAREVSRRSARVA
jgi:CBS domain-containing protein